jgi:prepilin-type N-terminal cleavage/methylation domain-containing protein
MRKGFSLMEVMIALVILGIAVSVFFRVTTMSQKNVTKGRSWQVEADLVERTIESLRSDSTIPSLQAMNTTWIDSSMGEKIKLHVVGDRASESVAPDFPRDMVAQMTITAMRVGAPDSVTVSTVLWSNQ